MRLPNQLLPILAAFAASPLLAQEKPAKPVELASLTPIPQKMPMKKADELIAKQSPPVVNNDAAGQIPPDNSYIVISLAKQRAWVMFGPEIVYIDTPVSTGKRAGMTPSGIFTVLQKDKEHHSSVYGDFVDARGRVVRRGVSLKVDSAPAGTSYRGAPMKFFCRLTGDGVGFHVGKLPGYPASHGCVRLPEEIAPLIYAKVKLGTPVQINVE